MKPRIVLVAMALSATMPAAAFPGGAGPVLRGEPIAIDGDTWFFILPDAARPGSTRRVTVRPAGIDAPELGQPCRRDGRRWWAGWDAGRWVTDYLYGKTVECRRRGASSYGRPVVDCTVDGADLQAAIVRAGWAYDYKKYSGGKYAKEEAEARRARRGLHAGSCDPPWLWRQRHY